MFRRGFAPELSSRLGGSSVGRSGALSPLSLAGSFFREVSTVEGAGGQTGGWDEREEEEEGGGKRTKGEEKSGSTTVEE